jgi:hypothetical protein
MQSRLDCYQLPVFAGWIGRLPAYGMSTAAKRRDIPARLKNKLSGGIWAFATKRAVAIKR